MLLYIILAFVLILAVLTAFKAKYNNRFKLIFLFGKKGSGKSTLLVKYMYQYTQKGFTCYTNMKECQFPNVRIIDINDVGDFIPEPYSVLCLDEVGIDYDSRKFKQFKDSVRDFYKLQRHYKVVCILASQSWDVDKKIRDLCDLFYLCIQIGPLGIGKQIRRKTVLTESTSEAESRISDNLKFTSLFSWKWTWMPKYHKYFDSFIAPYKPPLEYSLPDSPWRIAKRRKGKNGKPKGKLHVYRVKKRIKPRH